MLYTCIIYKLFSMQIHNLTRRGRPSVNRCIDRYFSGIQYQAQNHQKAEDAQVSFYNNFLFFKTAVTLKGSV
jgi:hypothetical protein